MELVLVLVLGSGLGVGMGLGLVRGCSDLGAVDELDGRGVGGEASDVVEEHSVGEVDLVRVGSGGVRRGQGRPGGVRRGGMRRGEAR